MNQLQTFNYNQNALRVLLINNEPYFVGKDVAEILGYKNTKDALITHVDEEDKRIVQRSEIATIENHIPKDVFPVNFVSADIPNRGLTVINESGVYSLVFGSKLPRAKEFKRWVTTEVLPAIRKHGAYMNEKTLEEAIANPDFLIKLATELKEEKEKRKKLEVDNNTMKPKALFADTVETSKDSILVGQLAKLINQNGYHIGQNRLFKRLREEGFLCSKGENYNMPTQRSMERGLMEIKERTVNNPDGSTRITRTPKITGKGQVYFVNYFLKKGELNG